MNKTSIEWTDYTWNPVTGCTKVSAGCRSCYAETLYKRFGASTFGHKFTEVTTHPERLDELRKSFKKLDGKKVFVCDMSDLFHESVPSDFITSVFHEMYLLPNTTFQVLTKRPERALTEINRISENNLWGCTLKNLWIGVSCEDQKTADTRIPILLQIPAAVRFLSCEPLIGAIDLQVVAPASPGGNIGSIDVLSGEVNYFDHSRKEYNQIDWVIVGGESGHQARPMHPNWVRTLRDQCNRANVPFFFKQWGEFTPWESEGFFWVNQTNQQHRETLTFNSKLKHKIVDRDSEEVTWFEKTGKSKSGNLLDGVQHLEFPIFQSSNLPI